MEFDKLTLDYIEHVFDCLGYAVEISDGHVLAVVHDHTVCEENNHI